MTFPHAVSYIKTLDVSSSDELDKVAAHLLQDPEAYERASQALRRRFVRGAEVVDAIDRGGRSSRIKREKSGGVYRYFIEGADGSWTEPEERIWVVAMYGLWQQKNTTSN